MKTFFKIFFGSCLGVLVGLFILFFVLTGMIGSLASSATTSEDTAIKSNSVLHLNLEGEITDRTYDASFLNFSFSSGTSSIGLFDIQEVLKQAKADKKIKILLIDIDKASFGIAALNQFLDFIEDFKKSGKLVYLYSNGATQKTFLVGAYADKMYLNPIAGCEFNGFVLENMFFTGLMEKVGVQPNIFYAGEFKSATEPFRLKENSPENELQLTELLKDIQAEYLSKLSKKINISTDSLIGFANQLQITQAIDAKKYGLVDDLKYQDELLDEIRTKLGYGKNENLNFVSYKKYKKSITPEDNTSASNQIAVLFAEGEIIDGNAESGTIAGDTYLKHIYEIQEKANSGEVKALVLRVNSGGGSAFASEQIWRALSNLKKKIPIVVSFGDVAASGGYYIACASDKIFAQQNTITGSIGVFGMLFNTQKLFNDKLGITTDVVKTNPYADFGNSTRAWTPIENAAMQRDIDAIYTLFKKRVADARKLSAEQVTNIAKGRIYSGVDAKAIGLIDNIGTLDDAIAEAKKLAKLNAINVVQYPAVKGLQSFLEKKLVLIKKLRS
ncbi:MAG: signal peptide peptidase SppA [Sphingobacteriales bacterium]|nr:MAG: signal peptide peptidase SppA [Sphingobacteriales bacterium]